MNDVQTMPPIEDIAPLLLVGGGNMGRAMLEGWLASGLPADQVLVIEPGTDVAHNLATELSVGTCPDFDQLPLGFSPKTIVFAVKPQILSGVASDYERFVGSDTLFLSIAAGKTITFFEDQLMRDINTPRPAVVRAMPNTPAAIGEGMTALCCNAAVTDKQQKVAGFLVSAVGLALWLEDESQMDAVTAVSGSGPAYVFALIEAMSQAGMSVGLPDHIAVQLATQTVKGAGLLAAGAGKSAGQLRREVTSPNGTTAAALDELLDPADGLGPVVARAVAAAARRSKELAG